MIRTEGELDNLTEEERFARASEGIAEILRYQREHPLPREKRVSGHTSSDWQTEAFGMFAGSELFEDAVRNGEVWRNADRPIDEGK